jgi:membrane-associated protein
MADETAPALPWGGKAQRADKALLSAIAFSGLYHLALLPLVPALIATHPLLLAVVRGSATAIVTLGALARTGEGSFAVALLAGLPATIMFDWVYWWAGRRWGEHALRLLLGNKPGAGARTARVHELSRRYGAVLVVFSYVIPIPNVLIDAAAGWGGMRLRTFLVCDVVAGLLWTGLLSGLGYAIGQRAVDVVESASHYALWLTLALVVYVIVRQVLLARRRPAA